MSPASRARTRSTRRRAASTWAIITDLTGVFKGVGVPLTEGQKAFWAKVNEDGGIGDYEVDVTKYVKDNQYNPDTHATVFGEIQDDILALGQSLGTAHTNGILDDAQAEYILILPASLGSNWIFEDGVIEVGTNYCAEAMNAVDYVVGTRREERRRRPLPRRLRRRRDGRCPDRG